MTRLKQRRISTDTTRVKVYPSSAPIGRREFAWSRRPSIIFVYIYLGKEPEGLLWPVMS